jgi:hypothetical protein
MSMVRRFTTATMFTDTNDKHVYCIGILYGLYCTYVHSISVKIKISV